MSAIILKSSGPSALFDAIRLGSDESAFIDPKIEPIVRQRPALANNNLTDREIEVWIRLDLRNIDIANELDVKLRVVEKKHRMHTCKSEVFHSDGGSLESSATGLHPFAEDAGTGCEREE